MTTKNPISIVPVAVMAFTDMIGFGIIIPLIPFYALKLSLRAIEIGLLLAIFTVIQFVYSPIERFGLSRGKKNVFLLSIFTSIISFLVFTFSNSYIMLLVSRIIAGFSEAGSTARSYVIEVTTRENRSKGMGILSAASGLGFIFGSLIGGIFYKYGFWVPGLIAIVFGLSNFIFVYYRMPEPSEIISSIPKKNFVASCRNIVDVAQQPATAQVFFIHFLITLAFSAIPLIVPLMAIQYYGFSELDCSYMFILISLSQVFLHGLVISKLVDFLGEVRLIVYGPFLMLLGMIAAPIITGPILLYFGLFLMSIGIGITNIAVPSFISIMTPLNDKTKTLGVIESVSNIARICGPLIGGVLVEIIGVRAPFLISGVLLLIPFLLGCRIFKVCTLNNLLGKDSEDREPICIDHSFR